MFFELLLNQLCFSGLRLHNLLCNMVYTWNIAPNWRQTWWIKWEVNEKEGRGFLHGYKQERMLEISKNVGPSWTGLMSSNQSKIATFAKVKDSRASRSPPGKFYLSELSTADWYHIQFCPPTHQKDSAFHFCSLHEVRRRLQRVSALVSLQLWAGEGLLTHDSFSIFLQAVSF